MRFTPAHIDIAFWQGLARLLQKRPQVLSYVRSRRCGRLHRLTCPSVDRAHASAGMALRVLRLNHNRIGDAGAVALSFLVRHGGPSPSTGDGENDGYG